jgi:hypothetical protein
MIIRGLKIRVSVVQIRPWAPKSGDFLVSLDTTTRTNVPDQLAELA